MTLISTDKFKTERGRSSRLTYRQFLNDPAIDPHTEWVDGEIIPMPPISNEHQDITGFLLVLMRAYVNYRKLGLIRYEPFQMKTGPDLPGRAPDILFVANANKKRVKPNHLAGPADVVVETISPGSRGRDRGEKFYEYEKGGVREYWLIDPQRKQAEFYHRGTDGVFALVPIGKDSIFRSRVLTGFWIKTSWLFQSPPPDEISIFKLWKLS